MNKKEVHLTLFIGDVLSRSKEDKRRHDKALRGW